MRYAVAVFQKGKHLASIYDLKPCFQGLLRPWAGRLAAAGVTANQVTLAALGLSLAAGWLVAAVLPATWVLLLLPPVLLVRMALNALDGMLAREHGQESPLGAILNELGDIVSDAALILPFALVPGAPAALFVVFAVLAGLAETAGILGQALGSARRYDGPLGKSDRALALGLLALALGLGVPAEGWLAWLVAGLLMLGAWTVWNRCRGILKDLRP